MTEEKKIKPMWSAIHHDRQKNLMFVWYTDGTRTAVKTKHRFFTPIRGEYGSSVSGMKDIYGRDMYEVICDSRTEMDYKNQNAGRHNHLSECDIDFRTRWLQRAYQDLDDIRFSVKDINICYLDIEVATKGKFPSADKALYPINCITIYFSKYDKYYTYGLNQPLKDETITELSESNCEYINCPTERDLLHDLFVKISENEVDVLTGWNCLDINGNVWLDDKIVKLKSVAAGNITRYDGCVNASSSINLKKSNIIKLSNGVSVIGSDDHRIPVIVKPKSRYVNSHTIKKYESVLSIQDIKKINVNEFDILFKQKIGDNISNDKTIRDIILNNIEYYLNDYRYDFELCDGDIKGSVTQLLQDKRINIDYINKYLLNSKYIKYSFKSARYNTIDLDTCIDNRSLYLLGLQYTDGSLDKDINEYCIYNTNNGIITEVSDIAINVLGNKSHTPTLANDGCTRSRYSVRKSIYGLLLPLIYNEYDNKELNITLLSQLSSDQFKSFFSGCIDGDGYITNTINFCNFNNNDIYTMQELLMWNGIVSTVHSNNLRISLKNNKYTMNGITLHHDIKASKLLDIIYTPYKDNRSKHIKSMWCDDCIYVSMQSITDGDICEMMDLNTDNHYFTYNGVIVHNCDFFDTPYIVKRAELLEVPLKLLSRLPDQYKTAYISKQDNSLVIAGTEVVDFLKLYRKFNFSERDNYKLDTIGALEVGERKAPLPNGYLTYLTDWDKFILYNFQDVRLMTKIEQKCRMFDATFTACSEARVPFSAIFESKKMLVGFILNFLHKKHLVMPPLKENTREWFPGAYVYATPGYYLHLVSYDYRSMYPSIMMGANISPETKVVYPIEEVIPEEVLKTLVRSPWNANGQRQVFYRKDISGIVPQVVKTLFDGRTDLKKMMKKVRKEGNLDLADFYDMKQKTYKLLGNSLYGLLGNPYFQLYDIDNSASVTAFGKALITTTVDRLCNYIDNEMKDDIRFEMLFGYRAPIDPQLTGSYESDEGLLTYRRVSHGDTDSFFVKYSDIYKPYMEMVDKKLEVVVFKGNELIERSMFDYVTEEGKAKKAFNSACVKYCPSWSDPETDNTKKKKIFAEGILMDKGYRVIYNRFCLTDFCRMMDAGIMEEKLAEFMGDYANQWNYYENTLFLKREKCIHQTIVTAKKKYICRIESNEDEKYLDKETLTPKAKFGITGLEIVRSSTTPFSRDHIMTLLDKMFKNMDKGEIRKEYLKIKEEFFQKIDRKEYYDISIPSGVKSDPPKYSDWITWSDTERSKVDWRLRAGSVWNHLIETDEVLKEGTLEPIFEASKVKFIKVCENKYGLNSIAYVGDKCPDRLLEIFTPDWNEQWIKTFSQTMDRLFEAVGWGKGLENDERDTMVDLF